MHPYLKNSLARPWSERRVMSPTAPLRVLVVDDNENAAEAIAAYLSLGTAHLLRLMNWKCSGISRTGHSTGTVKKGNPLQRWLH